MYKIFYDWLFYLMLAHFTLLIVFIVINRKNILAPFKKISKKTWISLLLIFLLGFFLRNSEYIYTQYSDCLVYSDSAKYWLVHGGFVKTCAIGNLYECSLFEQALSPPGLPFMIAVSYAFFGISSLNASVISAVLSSLSIILVFLIAYILSKKEDLALYSAVIYALIPMNILFSQTGLSRPSAIFFTGMAVLFYLIILKNRNRNDAKILVLLALALSYSIYIRQENYILIPLMALGLFFFKKAGLKKTLREAFMLDEDFTRKVHKALLRHRKFLPAVLIFLTFQLYVLFWLFIDNPFSSYNVGIFGVSAANIVPQSVAIMELFFDHGHYNILMSSVFILGIFLILADRNSRKLRFAVLWFFLYYLFYSAYHHMDVSKFGLMTTDYVRRTLLLHIPYSITAAFTVSWFRERMASRSVNISLAVLVILMVTLLLSANIPVSFSLFKDSRMEKGPEVDYMKAINKTPDNCLIISTKQMLVTNDFIANNNRKTIGIDLINPYTERTVFDEISRSNCNLYIDDGLCAPDIKHTEIFGATQFACGFIGKYLDLSPFFEQGRILIYNVSLGRDVPAPEGMTNVHRHELEGVRIIK